MISTDMEAVARILNHPKVYDMITDDTCIPPVIPCAHHLHLMNEEKTAVLILVPMNGITCEVHMAVLPELWGRAATFVRECIAWGWKNTRYMKAITYCPEYNRAAIALAKRCGFKEEGRVKDSFLKNWQLHDQIVFGLSK